MTKEVTLKVNLDTEDLMQKLINYDLSNPLKLQLKRVHPNVPAPYYATTKAACFDLHASLIDVDKVRSFTNSNEEVDIIVHHHDDEHHIIVDPYSRCLVPTGYQFGFREDYSLRLHPRSGSALKVGSTLANCQAIVDADFSEMAYFMVYNVSSVPLVIKHGERIGQGELVPVNQVEFEEVEDIAVVESNRQGGFGHTGQ